MKFYAGGCFVAILLALALFGVAITKPADVRQSRVCGYAGCPMTTPGMLNVHLVPHTHDDVGWLKTVDQYFYGARNSIQKAGVQYILDGVMDQLFRDPNKRFTWVETAFLWQWWQEQDDTTRSRVVQLVQSGQLEISGGAWSMHDEAASHYHSLIDQFTWGFRILNDTFGECSRPRIGWQIDPFGHSRESASLMAQFGFDGLFFARLDYQDKKVRKDEKRMELVWQASESLPGDAAWLFTHVLYNHYSPPSGFCFDILCNDEPFIDNPRSPDYNVDKRVDDFLTWAEEQGTFYNSNNIIMLMGEDFHYQSARMWYKNIDKLIKYVNARQATGSNVNIFYSTPACYVQAVNAAGVTWTTKQDDFFPYPNDKHSYWTGYFTSRPTQKYFERMGNNLLQTSKQLHSLSSLGPEQWSDLSSLRETLGVMQHHDAITGTEKQHVADNYALLMHRAIKQADNTASRALNKLMAKSGSPPTVDFEAPLLLNISQCAISEDSDNFVVTLYNPLAHSTSTFVRLPVQEAVYEVLDPAGVPVLTQMVPLPQAVLDIPGRDSPAVVELVFKATDIAPLGFKTYHVHKNMNTFIKPVSSKGVPSIGNQHLRVHLEQGRVTGITRFGTKLEIPINQEFLYYEGMEDNKRNSGAYVFRPRQQEALPLGPVQELDTFAGPLVEEVHQYFSDYVTQVIRVYEGEDNIEFEWLVGPIPVDDNIGKEVITRYSTGWATNGYFYTDANGREILERRRDFRPTWSVTIDEPVSGNYYPINAAAILKNGTSTLAVVTDRSEGGSSIHDGELELMLHRRLLKDDGYGAGEALNEQQFGVGLVARGKHVVLVGDGTEQPVTMARWRQVVQEKQNLKPWVMLAPTSLAWHDWSSLYKTQYVGAVEGIVPENIHLLTLEPWGAEDRWLLRLEHFLGLNDDPTLSATASVTLEDIFKDFTVVSAEEMALGANIRIADMSRFTWTVADSSSTLSKPETSESPSPSNKFLVSLNPMEIKTFIVQVAPRP